MWVFTTRGRDSPIDLVDSFLDKYKHTDGNRYIRTDQGGELAASNVFQSLVKKHNYVLETTAPDSSFQNGIVERGHCTLVNMIRSILRETNLGP